MYIETSAQIGTWKCNFPQFNKNKNVYVLCVRTEHLVYMFLQGRNSANIDVVDFTIKSKLQQ